VKRPPKISEQANSAVDTKALRPMGRAQGPMLEAEVAQRCQAERTQVGQVQHPSQVLVLQARLAMSAAAMVALALWAEQVQQALC